MPEPTDMTNPNMEAPKVPVDRKSGNEVVDDARRQARQNLWRIDRGVEDGQVVAPPDDGKRPEGGIIIPDNKNSI